MKSPATAGDLRFRIRFDTKVEVAADGGRTLSAWSGMGTGSFIRWADIRPLKGGEGVLADRLKGTQQTLLIVRADMNTKGIDASWRAVELRNGTPVRYFGLKSAADMERDNQFITMLAVEGDPDGGDDLTSP